MTSVSLYLNISFLVPELWPCWYTNSGSRVMALLIYHFWEVHRRCHTEKWRHIFKQIQRIKWIVGENRFLYRGIKYNIFGLIPKTSYVTQTLNIKYRGTIEPRANIYYHIILGLAITFFFSGTTGNTSLNNNREIKCA